jgi:hypothetical protein
MEVKNMETLTKEEFRNALEEIEMLKNALMFLYNISDGELNVC